MNGKQKVTVNRVGRLMALRTGAGSGPEAKYGNGSYSHPEISCSRITALGKFTALTPLTTPRHHKPQPPPGSAKVSPDGIQTIFKHVLGPGRMGIQKLHVQTDIATTWIVVHIHVRGHICRSSSMKTLTWPAPHRSIVFLPLSVGWEKATSP